MMRAADTQPASFWYRLGGFFCLLLVLGAAVEFAARAASAQGDTAAAESRAAALAGQLASAGVAGAAEELGKLPPGAAAWLIVEEAPAPGQLASLRKRKVAASTDAALVGKPPPKELAQEAASARSRVLEGKPAPVAARDGDSLRASAPLFEGQEVRGAALVVLPYTPDTGQGGSWMLTLGVVLGGALLGAAASRGEAARGRGLRAALAMLLSAGGLALLQWGLPPARGAALVGGPLAAWGAYWFGTGGLSKTWRQALLSKYAYAYIAPAMLGMVLLVFVPFAVGAGLSLFSHEFGQWTFVGLDNFWQILGGGARAITDPSSFFYKLAVTILWTTANVFFHVAIGLGLAMLLNQPELKGKGLYRIILILPWAVPSYITALIWKRMFHPTYGTVNAILGTEGLSWTDSFWKAFLANLTTNVWLGVPFMMVTCLGALQSIPKDLYEAAALDGASAWRRFWSITLPLLRPALLPAVILGMIWTFNMFNVIYLVSEGRPGGATDILVTEAYRYAFERQERGGEYGYAAAYSTIIFVILLFYSLGTAKVTGLTKGAD